MTCVALLLLAACTTDRTRRSYLERNALELAPPPRPVIVVPGFGVSRLFDPVTERFVWGTAHSTVQTRFADNLDLDANDRLVPRGFVGSRGPVNVGWQLTEALRKYGRYEPGYDVFPFAYDWRRSARVNARHLAELVETSSGGAKVDIVTHSAGALVALAYVKLEGGADRVENLILIAPPRAGVPDALRVLVRPERFLRRVFEPEMVATWPFVFELLPENGRFLIDRKGQQLDYDAWTDPRWEHQLAAARAFRKALDAASMPTSIRVTVIAGDCVPTAQRVLRRDDGTWVFYRDELRPDEESLAPILFESGDGTVSVTSARAGGEPILFCDGHQGLASDPSVHQTLIRLLRGQR